MLIWFLQVKDGGGLRLVVELCSGGARQWTGDGGRAPVLLSVDFPFLLSPGFSVKSIVD